MSRFNNYYFRNSKLSLISGFAILITLLIYYFYPLQLKKDDETVINETIKLSEQSGKPKIGNIICDTHSQVLPVRLTISKDNKIQSFGSYISEGYLFSALKVRSYKCESVKFYFVLEFHTDDSYVNQLIEKIDKLDIVQIYRPSIIRYPDLQTFM